MRKAAELLEHFDISVLLNTSILLLLSWYFLSTIFSYAIGRKMLALYVL